MKQMLFAALAFGSVLAGGPARAQSAPQSAPSAAAADTGKLQAARQIVAKLVPDGLYRRMMGDSMNQIMQNMVGSMGELPVRELARAGGISEEEVSRLGEGKTAELMALLDPHWQERMRLTMQAMSGELGEVMASMEPAVREALSQSYAREFSAAELADLARFFATPTGDHYAAQSMALFMAPEMVKAMSDMTPQLMRQMPAITAKAQAATKHLPPARTFEDLSEAERAKFSDLLGVPAAFSETQTKKRK